jgi:hypothetical protein
MAYSVAFKPQPLGKIAPVAGAQVSLAVNLTSGATDGTNAYGNTQSADDFWANKIEIKADSGNTGRVFIMSSNVAANLTTLANVIRALDPGESWSLGDYDRGNVYHVGAFYVDVETTGNFCHGSADCI